MGAWQDRNEDIPLIIPAYIVSEFQALKLQNDIHNIHRSSSRICVNWGRGVPKIENFHKLQASMEWFEIKNKNISKLYWYMILVLNRMQDSQTSLCGNLY
jgi:hypothetical protein